MNVKTLKLVKRQKFSPSNVYSILYKCPVVKQALDLGIKSFALSENGISLDLKYSYIYIP